MTDGYKEENVIFLDGFLTECSQCGLVLKRIGSRYMTITDAEVFGSVLIDRWPDSTRMVQGGEPCVSGRVFGQIFSLCARSEAYLISLVNPVSLVHSQCVFFMAGHVTEVYKEENGLFLGMFLAETFHCGLVLSQIQPL